MDKGEKMKIETETLLRILNLPEDEKIIKLFNEHSDSVLQWFRKVAESDVVDEVTDYKMAYSFFLLSGVLDFLNLKTLGSGIIKTTGIDAQVTELLTGGEIRAYKKDLEIRALETIYDYLTPVGIKRLDELKFGSNSVKHHRTRATVI